MGASNGNLNIFLLPEEIYRRGRKRSANMNGDQHEQMVKRSSKAWKKKAFPRAGSTTLPLVKDFRGFLRQARNLKAEEDAGLKTLAQQPKLALAPNAIERV